MRRRLDDAVARAVDCLCLPRQAGTPPRAYAQLSLRGKTIKIDNHCHCYLYFSLTEPGRSTVRYFWVRDIIWVKHGRG